MAKVAIYSHSLAPLWASLMQSSVIAQGFIVGARTAAKSPSHRGKSAAAMGRNKGGVGLAGSTVGPERKTLVSAP